MNLLEKLALPESNQKMIQEINYCKLSYDAINKLDDSKHNKEQQKKKILLVAFESLSGLFDLNYDQKLDFNKLNEDTIYIKDITDKNFDEAFYLMYEKSFYKYLEKMYMFTNNRIDDRLYTIARLAYLNKDEIVLKKLTDTTFNEFFKTKVGENGDATISLKDMQRLVDKNIERLKDLKNKVVKYRAGNVLSLRGIKSLYACFSSDVFSNMNKEEKLYISNLLFHCFGNQNTDIIKKYNRTINENTSNKECLSIIINELIAPGRTMLVLKNNKDTINNLLSGLPYIYENETKKEKLHSLDDLYKIVPKR